ncbi:hypothetical protein PVIIG_02827 [Plasmodium vivax India VII]|uniref:Uncharacterized protein n=1 Tax=Plasmodium vivax India VII TaxID=1077284 RepID=A0A0J9SEN2_PLAVI|nr:hypothetical protein PVIIG_02827 [Plasmodium vivax India VII]
MEQHTVLKEIKQSKNNCEAFFERHFRGLLPNGRGAEHEKEEEEEGISTEESEELQKRVHSLWGEVKAEKEYIDGEINAEVEDYRGMAILMKTHVEAMQVEMGKLFSNIDVADGKVSAGGGHHWKGGTSFSSDSGRSANAEVGRLHEMGEADEAHQMNESHELEGILRKSIDAKGRLENIKRGLLFLKAFPSLKKNMNELFLIVKNVQLDVNEKVKKAIILHSNLLYINEHEEIISYFKIYVPSIDVCIYSSEFFDNFFGLLNDILASFLSDENASPVDSTRILQIYVQTFRTYLKFVHLYVYPEGYLVEEITKKIVHFIVGNFRKTFLKFTQSESGGAVHNAVINYYEYFTTFVEEHQAAMRRLVRQLCKEVAPDCGVSGVSGEGGQVAAEDGERGEVAQVAQHEEDFLVRLYKEAIQVVGPFVGEQAKQLREDKSGAIKRKGAATHKIMDALSVSVNILSNSPLLIGKKNMLSRIINEATFMSDDVMAEHVVSLSDASQFDMHCFEEVNTKVSTFDRNDIMAENKLHTFFTQLEEDITKIIEKKKKEINTKEMFNSPFFKFIPFFSFTFCHDTEFLLLFINVYNFVYEIIYNMKDQIRRKKEENEKRRKQNLAGIHDDESRYLSMKEDLDSSSEVIQYVKTVMMTFIQIVNTFVNITKLYESFGKFLFERTLGHFTSRSLLNVISKRYLSRRGKYPPGVDLNIGHVHAYFEKGDFPTVNPPAGAERRKARPGERHAEGERAEERHAEEERGASPTEHNATSPAEQEAPSPDGEPPRGVAAEVQAEEKPNEPNEPRELDELECGKHLLKSSLCKLNDIKSTIIKNVIHFALIPLYDYTNRYTAKVGALPRKEETVESLDPEENICFIVETVFLYIHTFHEHGNKHLTDLLFEQIAEMFLSSVGSIRHLNESALRQLQADTQYFINVCKRLKVRNYKPFFLFSCSLSFVLARGGRDGGRDGSGNGSGDGIRGDASAVRAEVHAYLSECAMREGQEGKEQEQGQEQEHEQRQEQRQERGSAHPFGITSDDAATAQAHVARLLSCLQ